jgi:hypothetical protein
MDLLIRIFEATAIGIGVPLGFYLLAKLFPFKPQTLSGQEVSLDALRSKYAKWEIAALIPFFSFSGVSGYLIFQGLIRIFHHSVPQSPENRFLMLPDQYFFMLPALFAGILSGAIPTDLLYRLLLKKRYAEYALYGNLKAGFDGWKVVKFLAVLILIPSLIFSTLAMDCYARFTDDRIITNRYWGFGETTYNYNQITRIKSVRLIKAPNGNIVENPYHIVHFNNGEIWSTRNTFYRAAQEIKLSPEKEREILAFVAKNCGKEIERYDFLNKDEDR